VNERLEVDRAREGQTDLVCIIPILSIRTNSRGKGRVKANTSGLCSVNNDQDSVKNKK
jgi:hypothetical protein